MKIKGIKRVQSKKLSTPYNSIYKNLLIIEYENGWLRNLLKLPNITKTYIGSGDMWRDSETLEAVEHSARHKIGMISDLLDCGLLDEISMQ